MMYEDFRVTGTLIAYYIVCKRKLWLFSHQIEMEKYSDLVEIGKIISEESFRREKLKEIMFGDSLKVDFIRVKDEVIVHEVKKSRKLEIAHIWQVKFYIYCLKKFGVNVKKGVIHYPKLMRRVEINFHKNDEKTIELATLNIKSIVGLKKPPGIIYKPYCKKCAYYEFCYV